MKGYLDSINPTVAGWAHDETNPNIIPIVDIFIDGEWVYSINADLPRDDVSKVIGNFSRGFSVDLYDFTVPNKKYLLSVSVRSPSYYSFGNFEIVGISKVEIGHNGWLFLANDSNQTKKKLESEVHINDDCIKSSVNILMNRNSFLDTNFIKSFSLLIPDKSVICNSHRVFPYRINPLRESIVLRNCLIQNGIKNFSYPDNKLQENSDDVYYKTDTHMTLKGYLLAFEILQDYLSEFFAEFNELPVVKQKGFKGDLASYCADEISEDITVIDPSAFGHIRFDDPIPNLIENKSRLTGATVRVRNESSNGCKLYLLGTSSAYYALQVLSHIFKDIYFQWGNIESKDRVLEFAPDVFLWIGAERFLPLR